MSELAKLRAARERRKAIASTHWDDEDEITERITGLATAAAVAATRASIHDDSEPPKTPHWARHFKSAGAALGALVALGAALHELFDLITSW